MQQLYCGFRKEFLRDSFRQCICQSRHALYIRESLDLLRHGPLIDLRCVRIEGEQHVASSEDLRDLLVILIDLGSFRCAHGIISVEEVV